MEHDLRPGRSRPPLQGELELGRCRTTLCFIGDQKEEDREGGEDRNKQLCFKHLLYLEQGWSYGWTWTRDFFLNHIIFYVHLIGLIQFLLQVRHNDLNM